MRYLIINKEGRILNLRPKYPSSVVKLPALRRARIARRNDLAHAKALTWNVTADDVAYYAYGARGYKAGRAFHRLAAIYGFGPMVQYAV